MGAPAAPLASLAARLLAEDEAEEKRRRAKMETAGSDYHDLGGLEATTCRVERLFSRCKLILNALRASTQPILFEALMLLLINEDRWDALTVEKAMKVKELPAPSKWGKQEEEASW